MGSSIIKNPNMNPKVSQMAIALTKLDEQIDTEVKGQYGQKVIIKSGNVTIKNDDLDCEFSVDFDDDLAANEAEMTIYNLTNNTINGFVNGAKITIEAGYGKDTGIIFSGFITAKKTLTEGVDRVTTVRAIDDQSRQNMTVESISYAAGRKASYILKDLVQRVGLPIAVFRVVRDYTYTDEVTVDGSLTDAIKQYAKVCGVSAYICKSKIYVRSLNDGDNTRFKLTADTGLLSVSEFEEESKSEEYSDTVKGFEVEMLLQHRIQTASIIEMQTKNYKGQFRVREGTHTYNGSQFTTKAKVVAYTPYTSSDFAIYKNSGQASPASETVVLLQDSLGYVLLDSTGKALQEGDSI